MIFLVMLLLDTDGFWTPPVICLVFGAILVTAAIFGGGIKIKEVEIPKLNTFSRALAGIVGIGMVVYGIKATNKQGQSSPVNDNQIKPLSCSLASSLKSASTTGDTSILFMNGTDRRVKGFWIDFNGKTQQYFTLGPKDQSDDHIKQKTYEGHPWLIEDEEGHCLAVFIATAQDGLAKISR
jgi:hypothetical protein